MDQDARPFAPLALARCCIMMSVKKHLNHPEPLVCRRLATTGRSFEHQYMCLTLVSFLYLNILLYLQNLQADDGRSLDIP